MLRFLFIIAALVYSQCCLGFDDINLAGKYKATGGKDCTVVAELDRGLNRRGHFVEIVKVAKDRYKAVLAQNGGMSYSVKFTGNTLKIRFRGRGNEIVMSMKRNSERADSLIITDWKNHMEHGRAKQTFDVLKAEFPNKPNPIKLWSSEEGLCLSKLIAD